MHKYNLISQSDIIRTLINQSCLDESVMSMALSPDCTPPKLLERLTEAERFDLALDVSMKLGLDVTPLWRTWALRCLCNRNFQAAREKFRHCFIRLRLPGNRTSPAQSRLLSDILFHLARMSEKNCLLADEVELIKLRNYTPMYKVTGSSDKDDNKTNKAPHLAAPRVDAKPTIFVECKYYLNEYGGIEDSVKFYAKSSLWDDVVKTLLDNNSNKINLDKFFINDVLSYASSIGELSNLLKAFLKQEPNLVRAGPYFKTVYNFYMKYRRYNSLYYVQCTISDFLAAADTQINYFFLKKPTRSYRELNHRVSSLALARSNCQDYLDYIKQFESIDISPNNDTDDIPRVKTILSDSKVDLMIKTIDLQVKITQNFALNEVSGCVNDVELSLLYETKSDTKPKPHLIDSEQTDDSPVTLFEQCLERKTFLAALVLIYFDLSCSANMSKDGLALALELIEIYDLDKLRVFKTALRIIVEDESCDILENAALLLERVEEDYNASIRLNRCNYPIAGRSRGGSGNLLQAEQTVESQLATSTMTTAAATTTATTRTTTTLLPPLVVRQRSPQKRITGSQLVSQGDGELTTLSTSPLGSATGFRGGLLTMPPPSSGFTTSAPPSITRTSSPLPYPSRTSDAPVRKICDEIIRDAIEVCREPDYKMQLAKLLSDDAKIELYIEHGELSNAQRLACNMNRADYVTRIVEEAERLNQNHVKTVCQLWLAKHETKTLPSR